LLAATKTVANANESNSKRIACPSRFMLFISLY